MAKEYTELQLRAKEAGIKGWHVKLAKTLLKELGEDVIEAVEELIEEAQTTKVTLVEVAPVFEKATEAVEEVAEAVVEVIEGIDPMKLLRLLNGRSWDNAMMGIKCMAQKSDLWEFRDFIEVEYKKELKEIKAKAKANGNK